MKELPDTKLILEATSLTKAALSTNIYNHSMRTFHLGCEYAEISNIRFSKEELALSSLFHDIGFLASYRTANKPFQIGSSTALKNFLLKEQRVHPNRINAMMEAIDFHFQFKPRWDKGEISGLLQIGAHMDVLGKNSHFIEINKRKEILENFPKKNFFLEFNLCLFRTISGFSECIGLLFPETYIDQDHYLKVT